MSAVGLEMTAFSPLVPRVDEHEPFVDRPVGDRVDDRPETFLEPFRRRIGEDDGVTAAPGRVVEADHDARVRRELGARGAHRPARGCVVVALDAVVVYSG